MFINRTHKLTALRGTYIFPYRIGKEDKDRSWQPTSSSVLSGGLSESSISNQLFSTNYRLGFVGAMVKSIQILIESIEVATLSGINMDVKIYDTEESLMTDRNEVRELRWKRFEEIINHTFGLVVR